LLWYLVDPNRKEKPNKILTRERKVPYTTNTFYI
jgi:hypothetical protein